MLAASQLRAERAAAAAPERRMSDQQDILGANERFYQAFAGRDVDEMDRVWAQTVEVACIHPGWNPIAGRDAVMDSWRSILDNPSAPEIRCLMPTVFQTDDFAFVTCFEAVDQGFLVATNIYVRENGGWKLIHHQAGPTAEQPVEDMPDSTVH